MYGKELIQMAVQYFKDPTQFCQLVGLCPSTKSKVNMDLQVQSLFTGVGPVLPAKESEKVEPKVGSSLLALFFTFLNAQPSVGKGPIRLLL